MNENSNPLFLIICAIISVNEIKIISRDQEILQEQNEVSEQLLPAIGRHTFSVKEETVQHNKTFSVLT